MFRFVFILLLLHLFALQAPAFAPQKTHSGSDTTETGQPSPKADSIPITTDRLSPGDSSGVTSADTTAPQKNKRTPSPRTYPYQLRVGVDLARIGYNILFPSRQAYEVQADYALKKDVYLAAEAGLGRGTVSYDYLQYQTDGYFVRLGVDKSLLDRLTPSDFDIGFIGFRYGVAVGKRQEAQFRIPSPFGDPIQSQAPAQSFVVHWGELVGGIKVEVWNGLFFGWTGRAKFMFNSGIFKTLSPNFIAGYGKGDKTTVFDFSFYVSYALRWNKKTDAATTR